MLLVLTACGSPFTPVYDDSLLVDSVQAPTGTDSMPAASDQSEAEQSGAAPAGSKALLRCALSGDNWSVEYEALTQISMLLSEETGGRCSLELYPGAVLGEEEDTLQMLSEGSLELCVVGNTALSSVCEDFSILSAPYVFESLEEQERFYETGDLSALFKAPADSGFTVLRAWSAGSCCIFTRAAPISVPEDLAGMNLGALEKDLSVSPLSLMGGNTIGVRAQDFCPALQIGSIDGAESDLVSYMALEYWTVAPYYNNTSHRFLTNELVISNSSLEALSAEDQDVLLRLLQRMPSICHNLLQSRIADCESIAEACGVVITEVNRQAFQSLCEAELDRIADRTELTRRIYDEILSF